MKRLLAILGVAALTATMFVAPAAATTNRISIQCEESRLTEWSVDREWLDEDFVYHIRGESADYLDVGSPYCAGINHATANVNLDLLTGEGVVTGTARIDLDAFDGGWNSAFVAHFIPTGPYIWEGQGVGHGFGALAGYEYRVDVVETSHEGTIVTGFVFLPGE